MGGVALWDLRLRELATIHPHGTRIAVELAVAQLETYHHTGHLLALSDEYVWRKLKQAAKDGVYGHVYVRCMLCGERAYLRHWVQFAPLWPVMRAELRGKLAYHGQVDGFPALEACDGRAIRAEELDKLRALAGC